MRDTQSNGISYHAPSTSELLEAERLFEDMILARTDFDAVRRKWAALQFELISWQADASDEVWIVRETPGRRSGRGVYAIRPRPILPLVIQAPHGFYDTHTREICADLAGQPEVAAAAWNTVHRSIVDTAHVQDHYFNAFTRAVAAALPGSVVVQFHGFTQAGRRTAAGASAEMIVSNGSHYPTRFTGQVVHRIQQVFPDVAVKLYPSSVQELGATTNVQGAVVRAGGDDQFLSIELNRLTRDRLLEKSYLRGDLFKVLVASVRITAIEEDYRKFIDQLDRSDESENAD